MGNRSLVVRGGQAALVLACLFLAPLRSTAAADDQAPAQEESEPEFESLERKYTKRWVNTTYSIGDYVVKPVGRTTSKYDRKSDVETSESRHDVVASSGAGARIESEQKRYYGVEYPPDSSLGGLVLEGVLESVTGISLGDGTTEHPLLTTIVSATIILSNAPDETWQLEAEILPIPNSERFANQSDWGYGTLTNGTRKPCVRVRGASPWSEEECLGMIRARDERVEQCHRKLTEIAEDGEPLGWKDTVNQYNVRAGLVVDTKLLLLAMFEVVAEE